MWITWALGGVIGPLYMVMWVIKATKNDPVLGRIGWLLAAIGAVIPPTDIILIKDMGIHIEYWQVIMDQVAIPMLVLMLSLIFIGGYQKVRQPGFDPEKRRGVVSCMYVVVITVICIGLLFAGFYIYDIFF